VNKKFIYILFFTTASVFGSFTMQDPQKNELRSQIQRFDIETSTYLRLLCLLPNLSTDQLHNETRLLQEINSKLAVSIAALKQTAKPEDLDPFELDKMLD